MIKPYWSLAEVLGQELNQLIEKELGKLFLKMFRLFGNAGSYISKIIKKHNASNVQVFAL
jgi:hypothetical protein